MLTLEDIRQSCVMQGKHWIWRGAEVDGLPRIWAPDLATGTMRSMPGHRAVMQMVTGKPIPKGMRAYRTCNEKGCVSPECGKIGPTKAWGELMAERGNFRTTVSGIARRNIARKNRALTDAQIQEAQLSDETCEALGVRYGCSPDVISRAKRGHYRTAGPFSGLMGSAA